MDGSTGPDEFDRDFRTASAPEGWVGGLERVWRMAYTEEELAGDPDPVDEYLFAAWKELRRVSMAISLRLDTRYLADEAYLGDTGTERVRAAVQHMVEARTALEGAIGSERVEELERAELDRIHRRVWGDEPEDG